MSIWCGHCNSICFNLTGGRCPKCHRRWYLGEEVRRVERENEAAQQRAREARRLQAENEERARNEQILLDREWQRAEEAQRLAQQQHAENERAVREEAEAARQRRLELRQGAFGVEPAWLAVADRPCHIGLVGSTGTGKSSLNNALRGVGPDDPGYAPTGITQTTMDTLRYPWGDRVLCDNPGVNTADFPEDEYLRRMSIGWFDAAVVVVGGRTFEYEEHLVTVLRSWQVPTLIVRTKVDVDVSNGREEQQFISEVLRELERRFEGAREDVFAVTSRGAGETSPLSREMQRLRARLGHLQRISWHV